VGVWVFVPLMGALVAKSLELSVVWALVALWVGASARLLYVATLPRVRLTGQVGERAFDGVADELSALVTLAEQRSVHPGLGPMGLDELFAHQVSVSLGPLPARLRLWSALFAAQLLLLPAWVALWAFTLLGTWVHEQPAAESLVVLGMGPPLSVLMWPATAVLGLVLQTPVVWLLSRR
jgi:hypothetical protein